MSERYAMIIDLKRCVACDACTIACRQASGTVHGVLLCKVLKYETGDYPESRLRYLPVMCNHCDNPPCAEVCPAGAVQKLRNGIVTIDPDLCIGCQSCALACPYGARTGFKSLETYFAGSKTPFEEAWEDLHPAKKMKKCNFCLDRLAAGREPACVEACPGDARVFGNLNDPGSRASRLLAERRSFRLRTELGLGPAVYYLTSD